MVRRLEVHPAGRNQADPSYVVELKLVEEGNTKCSRNSMPSPASRIGAVVDEYETDMDILSEVNGMSPH